MHRRSNEALPQPISKRKDKEHKKKKSKVVSTVVNVEAEVDLKTANAPPEVASYNAVVPANAALDKKPGRLVERFTNALCTRTAYHPGLLFREIDMKCRRCPRKNEQTSARVRFSSPR